jgi:hypothetical protein
MKSGYKANMNKLLTSLEVFFNNSIWRKRVLGSKGIRGHFWKINQSEHLVKGLRKIKGIN